SVLRADPDWSALPADTPPAIRTLLRRCLQKDRARRLRSMGDARFQIEEAAHETPVTPAVTAPARRGRERLWIAAAVVAIVASLVAATIAVWSFSRGASRPMETRLQVVTPPAINLTSFA